MKKIWIICLLLIAATLPKVSLSKAVFSEEQIFTDNQVGTGSWASEQIETDLCMSGDRRFASLTAKNLRGIKKLHYKLTYQSGGREKGVEGNEDVNGERWEKDKVLLGSCSDKDCTYDRPHNLKMELRLTDEWGGVRTIEEWR